MLLSAFLMTAVLDTAIAPPPTRAEPVIEVMHGEELADPFRWLEALERECEDVKEWTNAQNAFTRAVLDAFPGRAALESRLRELMQIDSINLPTMRGNLYFHTRRLGDQPQPILYVREGHDGDDRVLLDPAELDDDGLYSLDWYEPSHDGKLVAFGLSYAGDEMTVLHVLETASGEWLADEISGKVTFAGWMPDASGFLYGVLEDPEDAYSRAFRFHTLGRHPRNNPLLFEQEDPSRIPFAQLSNDGRWIVAGEFAGWAQQDLYVVNADEWRRTGEVEMREIAVGFDARFSPQVIHGDYLYMLTTLDAPNGIIIRVDLNNPDRHDWRPLFGNLNEAVLRSVEHARGMLIATYQEDATTRIRRYRLDGTPLHELQLPGLGTASVSTEPDRTEAFIRYTSYNEPTSIYRVDIARPEDDMNLWARPDVPVDVDAIEVKQEWATSADGTKVPIFIVHRRGLERDGDNPTVLYGYGGFNISVTPSFIATNFPWYEAGGVFAVANLRGGGEFGRGWHKSGMLGNKQNVFDDFYAAAEHLIDRGYTNPERLGIYGRSNGGLLTGVAITQRPDLFTAAVSGVPLLDMLRYHQFLMARFWVPEYGSPDDSEHFTWLRAYSPYHNVEAGAEYPSVLFTAGENDTRVHPMHARKMAALMQAKAANDPEDRPILLWVDREAGHGRGKPLHLRVQETADRWAFFMRQLGVSYDEP